MNGLLREFTDMVCYVIDVDDTLLDTKRRTQGVWRLTLDKEVPLSDIEASSLEQIFMKHASEEQKGHARELQGRFFSVLLCEDEVGVELASLDQAVPYAAETLQRWATEHELVYLTGRTENTRELTLGSLRRHGFPTDEIPLLMVHPGGLEEPSPDRNPKPETGGDRGKTGCPASRRRVPRLLHDLQSASDT